MHIHRAGYIPGAEHVATHSRKRYRLLHPTNNSGNSPQCDQSLWIIHYTKAEPKDQMAARSVPVPAQVQNQIQMHRFFQSQGQLQRKEFMLNDRASWPTINLPSGQQAPNMLAQNASYNGKHPSRGQLGGVPPTKRPYQPPGGRGLGGSMGDARDIMGEEDEDGFQTDLLDYLTPREISKMRYTQHHEWMEEIFSSPYATNQIMPNDLGLGRKGVLESFTHGFFDAPTATAPTDENKAAVSAPQVAKKLGADRAREFTKRAEEKLAGMNAEIEKMKRQHARRMAKIERIATMKDAENRLRNAITDDSDYKSPFWNLTLDGHEDDFAHMHTSDKIDDVVKGVEQALGRRIQLLPEIDCREKGGLEERAVEQASPAHEQDIEMGHEHNSNGIDSQGPAKTPSPPVTKPQLPSGTGGKTTASGLLDQFRSSQNTSTPPTTTAPVPFSPPQNASQTNEAQAHQAGGQLNDRSAGDVEMGGMLNNSGQTPQEGDNSEWVMVQGDEGPQDSEQLQQVQHSASGTPRGFENTPRSGSHGLNSGEHGNSGQDANESHFDHAQDFEHLDSAGDALAAYDEQNVDLDLGDHGDLGLDDTAFGDAFHPPEEGDETTGM